MNPPVRSDPDALDLSEGEAVVAAVVELGGAGAGVVGHGGGVLQRAAVLEVGGDAGGAEAVVADRGGDAGGGGAAADHGVGVGLRQGRAGELAGAAADGAEQRPLRVAAQAGAVEVGGEVVIKVVVAGHLVPLAAL